MAARISQRFALLLLVATVPAVANVLGSDDNSTEFINASCRATLYPDLCYTSLASYAGTVQRDPVRLARAATNVSLARICSVQARMWELHRATAGRGLRPTRGEVTALRDCNEVMRDAADETRRSAAELGRLETSEGLEIGWRVSNVQTWMSATLTNEETCADGLDKAAEPGPGSVAAEVCRRVREAKIYTSNALALVNRLVASS